MNKLNALIQQRQTENAALRKLAEDSAGQFRSLQQEYDALAEEYRDLARPARRPAGKYVVEVWLDKRDHTNRFRMKAPGEAAPRAYTQIELNKILRNMKARYGGNLYTKVIIPENSKLSYNEAWQLTQDILRRFDYY